MLVSLFKTILSLSFMGAVVALIIFLVKAVVKDRLSAKWHYLIWILLVLRLVLPFSISTSLSIFNVMPDPASISGWNGEYTAAEPEPYIKNADYYNNSLAYNEGKYKSYQDESSKEETTNWWFIGAVLWMTGTLILLLLYAFSYLRVYIRLSFAKPCIDESILRIVEWCKSRAGVKAKAGIYVCDTFDMPCVFGLFNPRIIIPEGLMEKLDENRKRHVFLHEIMHIKWKDNVVNIILLLLQSLHWFNPVLWCTLSRLRKDCESACDERVLRNLDSNEHKEYAMSLLAIADEQRKASFYSTVLAFGESNIKRRILGIMRFKRFSISTAVFAVIVSLVVSVVVLTSAVNRQRELITQEFQKVSGVELHYKPLNMAVKSKSLNIREHREIIKEIYDIISAGAENAKTYINPKEMDRQESDPHFKIIINYTDGQYDEILSTETGMFVFRFLDQKGSWTGGKNVDLLSIVESLVTEPTETETSAEFSSQLVEAKLKIIMESGPLNSSNTYDYIRDSREFEEIVAMGKPALNYMLNEFSKSNANTLKEDIMALACSKILGEPGFKEGSGVRGRDWYYKVGSFIKYMNDQQIMFTEAGRYVVDGRIIDGRPVKLDRTDMEQVISNYINEKEAAYSRGEKLIEAHKVYRTEEKNGKIFVYMYVTYSVFGFENGCFTVVSGGSYPAVMTLEKSSTGEFQVVEYNTPMAGADFKPSIQKMFPHDLVDKVMRMDSQNKDELWNIQVEKAKKYLESIGRKTAPVVRYVDKRQSASGIGEEFYKIHLMRHDFPDWEGTREILVRAGGPAPGTSVRVILETKVEEISKGDYLFTLTKTWNIKINGKQPVSWWKYRVTGDNIKLMEYEDNDRMVNIIK